MRRSQLGLTLLEMLVTLVIVGLASTLVIQSVYSLAQVDQRLRDWQGVGAEQVMQRFWLQQIIAGIVPGRDAYDRQFVGRRDGFSGWITNPPWPDVGGPLWVNVQLVADGRGKQQLVLDSPGLSRWVLVDGVNKGYFEYLAQSPQSPGGVLWQQHWQLNEQRSITLQGEGPMGFSVPLAVRLVDTETWLDLTVPVTATRNPQLSQSDLVGG